MTAKIKLNSASGGGSFSLQAPSSSSNDRVITLPDIADGTLLTSQSTGLGKVLQVIQTVKTDTTSHANGQTREDISGITVNITPSATSSKILISSSLNFCGIAGGYSFALYLMRDSTDLAIGDAAGTRARATIGGLTDYDNGHDMRPWHYTYLDSPNTTSQVTYKWQWNQPYHSQTMYLNRVYSDADNTYSARGASNIIVQEIAA